MAKKPAIYPCRDIHQRTCIHVARSDGRVKYIPMDIMNGLLVVTTQEDAFDSRFSPMENYPPEKACQLYVTYSQALGATDEAMGYLGQIVKVSKQELEVATTKKQTADAGKVEKAATKKAKALAEAPVKKAAPVKKTEVKKAAPVKKTEVKKAAPVKKTEVKKASAAQMFQDLIMEGKLTDEQIFEVVQTEYGLDDKKRGYVRWYRNHLKKSGSNPPEPK